MNVLFAGGGTGGHVFPAIAVAEELLIRDPGAQFLFVGSHRGLEARIIPDRGYSFQPIASGALKGKTLAEKLATLAGLPATVAAAARIVRQFNPDVVVGIGGYASGPALIAAALRGKPAMILEQNFIPGLTNRMLAYVAKVAAVNFEESVRFFPGNAVATGNPIRREFFRIAAPSSSGRFTILIFGGSQGAHAINQAVVEALPFLGELRQQIQFIHQTGSVDEEYVRASYRENSFVAEVQPFFDQMAEKFESSHVVIGRAGASTLGEIAATGRPSVLIPLPTAADNHQWKNAEIFVRRGASIVIEQAILSGERLARVIHLLARNPARRSEMGQVAAALAVPDSASRIADWVRLLAGRKPRENGTSA